MKKEHLTKAALFLCCILLAQLAQLSQALPVQEGDAPDGNVAHRFSADEQQAFGWYNTLIQEPGLKILGESCYNSLINDLNYQDTDCMKLAFSKVLGFGIVLGGAVIKIPQIIIILRHRSVQGLSQLSFLLETCAYLIVLIYNVRHHNPFSTFGEVVFMTLQNILISYMIVHYNKKKVNTNNDSLLNYSPQQAMYKTTAATTKAASSSSYINEVPLTLAFLGLTGCLWIAPGWLMSLCYAAQIPIGLASKIPQIRENYKNKSTGQLSVFAVLNYFFGTVARTFTTWTEIHDDLIMLGGNLLASILNGVLVLQMAVYWRNTRRKVVMSMQKLQ